MPELTMRRRGLIGIAAGCSLSVLAIAAAWPLIAPAYMRGAATELGLFLSDLGGNAAARYEGATHRGRPIVAVSISHPRWPSPSTANTRVAGHAYFQSGLLLSLCIWSPVPWRRRVAASALGLLILALVHLLTVWLYLVAAMMTHPIRPFDVSSIEFGILNFCCGALALRDPVWLAIPVLLWITLTFRREDFRRILDYPPTENRVLGSAPNDHEQARRAASGG